MKELPGGPFPLTKSNGTHLCVEVAHKQTAEQRESPATAGGYED